MIFNLTGGGIAGGGSGAGLNFKVVGGTTEPTNPTENTIWVNTATEITSWLFSATEPETPAEGMVWFAVNTSACEAEFNALKKNGIQVYPSSANQYVNGAWVGVTAMSHQNGEWVSWRLYVYKRGDQSTGITGGWTPYIENYDSSTLTYESEHLRFWRPETAAGLYGTVNKVDFGSRKTIFLDYLKTGTGGTALSLFSISSTGEFSVIIDIDIPSSQTRTSISADISALNGTPVYLGFRTNSPNDYAMVGVYNLWAE